MQQSCLTTLLGIQGFQITSIEQTAVTPARSVILIHMERIKEGFICSACGQAAPSRHKSLDGDCS